MEPLFTVACTQPWLLASFAAPQRMASWSINRPGIVDARRVAWLEVRDADLPPELDPLALLHARLDAADLADAVALMTSRDVRRHRLVETHVDGIRSQALATVGLTNGVAFAADGSVEARRPRPRPRVGTINLLLALSCRLADPALLEALSIAATARTAALLAEDGTVAATGTDCIVLACPSSGPGHGQPYAGLHTAAGRSLAQAAYRAVRAARQDWEVEFGCTKSPS
jgi:adenosylcobinamide amidohydrolase